MAYTALNIQSNQFNKKSKEGRKGGRVERKKERPYGNHTHNKTIAGTDCQVSVLCVVHYVSVVVVLYAAPLSVIMNFKSVRFVRCE